MKVIAFDEAQAVLQGIADGTVVGTIVQNPFQYGFKSIETLHSLKAGKADAIPESKFINIPARVVLADDSRQEFAGAEVVPGAAFRDELAKLLAGGGAGAAGEGPEYAFITNGVADFWTIGKAGALKAAADLGVKTAVIMPSSITDQTRKIEDLLTRQGLPTIRVRRNDLITRQGEPISPQAFDVLEHFDLVNHRPRPLAWMARFSEALAACGVMLLVMRRWQGQS